MDKIPYKDQIRLNKLIELEDWDKEEYEHLSKVTHGMKDCYDYYKKLEKENKDFKKVYYNDYPKILRDYFELAYEDLLLKGRPLFLFGLGWLIVEKRNNFTFKVDWAKTMKTGRWSKFSSQFHYYRFTWLKTQIKRINYYMLRPHKNRKKLLSSYIKKNKLVLSGLCRTTYKIKGFRKNVI